MKNLESSREEFHNFPVSPQDYRHKLSKISGTKPAQEKRRTKRIEANLPELIKMGRWSDDRRKSFYVRYGTDRKLTSFASERERNDFVEKLAENNNLYGAAMLADFNVSEWQEFREWKKRRDENKSPVVKDAAEKYTGLRLKEGLDRDGDNYRHVVLHLGRFCQKFGHLRMDQLDVDEIRSWLLSLRNPDDGALMSDRTIKNHRKDLNIFFERAILEEWTVKNPFNRIFPPKIEKKAKEALPVRQLFQLLHENLGNEVVYRIALELFGGLRCKSAALVELKHIRFADQGIVMNPEDHKSGNYIYRDGHPAVLWKWLDRALANGPTQAFRDASVSDYGHKKSAAFRWARVENPGNGLRESFCSYHLALCKSYELTGYFMQHTHKSTTMIYEGVATKADAELVFAMTPEAVSGTWEDFLAVNQKPNQHEQSG